MSLPFRVRSSLLAIVVVALTVGSEPAAAAEEARPSEDYPVVELVTMGIGSLIWEKHGHIAVCVRYEEPKYNICFNYGMASFHEPFSMAWGFIRGHDTFWAQGAAYERMLQQYVRADRTVWIQELPLTKKQKKGLIAKLRSDILLENRYYSYDHFWDNCTTRIRDVLDDATDGAYSTLGTKQFDLSYRDLARDGFYEHSIALLITDIFMGSPTDALTTYWDAMYLPKYMRGASIEALGAEPVVYYQRKGRPHPTEGPPSRLWFALCIFLLTASSWLTRLGGRFERLGLALPLIPAGLLGLWLWGLAIASPVPYLRFNESLMVFVPLDLFMPFLSVRGRQLYGRARVALLMAYSLLLAVGVFDQPIYVAVLWPLIPALVASIGPRLSGQPSPSL